MVNGEYISIEEAEKYLDKEIAKREELLDYLIRNGASTSSTYCEIDLLHDMKKRLRLWKTDSTTKMIHLNIYKYMM